MKLSNDLISQFVKVTNDTSKTKKESSTVYGTVISSSGDQKYVQIDGSDITTPMSSAVEVSDRNRVMVTIKDHNAIITSNLSDPSASSDKTYGLNSQVSKANSKITELEIAVADRITTDTFNAARADIDKLQANEIVVQESLTAAKADISTLQTKNTTVEGKLAAAEANITDLSANKLSAEDARATYATIENLSATDAKVNNLESTYAKITDLEATEAKIDDLTANALTTDAADIKYATIEDLNAAEADIVDLNAEVADVNTLIFGSATGDVIQSSFANAVIAQLGDAQIKSTMIENVSASKITAGDIITNNVRVKSEDGSLIISDETLQISDGNRVRVQIGKDASNDYSINIWDQNGNLMFSKGGITDAAIKSAIIRNDMVSDTANIHASKLDINSLFSEINSDGSNTIKSTKVYLDDENQTLDVAFKELTTDVSEQGETISSQGTAISTIQGQISSKIWQQDINTAKNEMSTQYSTLEQDLDGFKSTVSNTYATNTAVEEIQNEVDNITIGGRNLIRDSKLDRKTNLWSFEYNHQTVSFDNGYVEISRVYDESYTSRSFNNQHSGSNTLLLPDEISGVTYVLSADLKAIDGMNTSSNSSLFWRIYYNDTDFEELTLIIPNDLSSTEWRRCYAVKTFGEREWLRSQVSIALQNADNGICVRNIMLERANKPSAWSAAPEDLEVYADDVAETAKSEAISETLASVNSTLQNYATLEITDNKISSAVSASEANVKNYADGKADTALTESKSYTDQTANSITTAVSSTYTTKTEFESLEIGGRNLVRDSKLEGVFGTTHWTNVISGGIITRGDGYVGLSREEAGTARLFFTQYAWSNPLLIPEIGETYTISADLKILDGVEVSSGGSVFWRYYYEGDDGAYGETSFGINPSLITEDWQRFHVTKTIALSEGRTLNGNAQISVAIGNNIGGIAFRNIKIEKGSKPTNWTPAPEDMATADSLDIANERIENVNEKVLTNTSLIEQLSESISMLVTDGNGASLMTQTENGWTFSTGDIQTLVNKTSEDLAKLTDEVGDTNHTITVLEQAVADLGEIAEYVKITTYEDEPCIELGEGDSEFKLRITNTRMMFTEGSTVLAYFNNQSLHVKKIVVEEEFQQGGFVWKARANGNLGLVWKGGN